MKFLIYLCDRMVILSYKGNADVVMTKCLALVSIILAQNILFGCSLLYMLFISKHILPYNKEAYFSLVLGILIVVYVTLKRVYTKNYFLIVKQLSEQISLSKISIVVYFVIIWCSSMLLFGGGLLCLRKVLY